MLILAADTSGKHGSIALVRCEGEAIRALDLVSLQGGTFSAQLIPQIAELLSRQELNKTEIDAFAVVSGPGSFTGLRVGLAAIKALAEILRKPIAPVSLLEAIDFDLTSNSQKKHCRDVGASLAANVVKCGDPVLIALDAGRNEAFVGEYKMDTEFPICISESLLTFGELAARVSTSRESIYTPDENVYQSLVRCGQTSANVVQVDRPNAVSVARLGYKKILAGRTVSTEQLDATYIRRADAEIKKSIQTLA
jgi:tRNA threonylcarbamoyladenosine biosynthesis protein TsaB